MSILPPHEEDVGEQLDYVQELLQDADASEGLSEWEITFCDSLRDRIQQYGARTRISPKQWAVMERIEQKLYGWGDA